MITYGTSAIPNSVITVREQTSTAVSLLFDNAVGIVGGYDASEGNLSASDENTNIEVNGTDDARKKFGENSELYRQVQLAYLNNAGRVVCTPVGETTVTESFGATSSISLSNEVLDPRFNPEEDITATDTTSGATITVNIVDGTPSTPSNSETLNINPQTGEGEFDTSSDYDITYTKGDYSTAVNEAAKANVRFSAVCSASENVINTELTGVKEQAKILDFKRLVGAVPTAVDPANYSILADDQRLVLGAPTYGTAFDDTEAFLNVAIASQMASEPLGSAAYGNSINGFSSLSQDFAIGDITDFGSGNDVDRVTVVHEGLDGYEIVEDLTASTGSKFRDVYKCEVIDDITYNVNLAADAFIDANSPNTPESRSVGLEAPVRTVLRAASSNSPPLLSSTDGSKPYTIASSVGASADAVNLELGIDVTDLTKTVDVTIGVGAINTFEGAE